MVHPSSQRMPEPLRTKWMYRGLWPVLFSRASCSRRKLSTLCLPSSACVLGTEHSMSTICQQVLAELVCAHQSSMISWFSSWVHVHVQVEPPARPLLCVAFEFVARE